MPNLLPSCCTSKVFSNFNDGEQPHKPDGIVLGKPTLGEYTGEGAKSFLQVLESVAELIPIPGVAPVVKVAKIIIEACDDSYATLKRAQYLKSRIENLVLVLIGELKGKKEKEIEVNLRADIQILSKDLEYIQGKLNEIGSQHAVLLVIFRGFNEGKVQECLDRLNDSLQNFHLKNQISDAQFRRALQQQILTFYGSLSGKVDDVNGKVGKIQETLNKVQVLLRERLPPTSSAPLHIRTTIPANSNIFFGRDVLVRTLVHALTSTLVDTQKSPRVCLLGPGGIGKTSTALAVMEDTEMRKHFPEKNQIWVPCVKATSFSLFLDTLYSSLGATLRSGDTLQDIISEIKSSSEPLVILLDNFETPWNVEGSRSEIERILYQIDRIQHVALFITMRGSIPPCSGSGWQSFSIAEVDETAARQIYISVCPGGCDDPKLPELLQALGHMPLAITLIATLGEKLGIGAGQLLTEYQQSGTGMVEQAKDASHSLNICISLSVDSRPMKSHPEAYKLLAILAMLPTGTTHDTLAEWWAASLPNLLNSLQVLADTSLIQRRGMHYSVLPVIRSYIFHSQFPDDVRARMIASACNFLTHHESSPGEPSFKSHSEAVSKEESNLQEIFLQCADHNSDLIEAILLLGQHQLATRPRLELIEHALKLARRTDDYPLLLGDVLVCYGRLLLNLDRYDQAIEHFKLAQETFLSIPNKQRVARCLLDLVDVHMYMNTPSQDILNMAEEAQSIYEELDDSKGIALSWHYVGIEHGRNREIDIGIGNLIRAKEMFKQLEDSQNVAMCSHQIQDTYRMNMRYDDALSYGIIAVQEYEDIGINSGEPMLSLGICLFVQGIFATALETLVRTVEISKLYGRPTCIAQTLEVAGRTLAKMARKGEALDAYAEAIQFYSACHASMSQRGITRCNFLIKLAENPYLKPTESERLALMDFYADFR